MVTGDPFTNRGKFVLSWRNGEKVITIFGGKIQKVGESSSNFNRHTTGLVFEIQPGSEGGGITCES